ncbi:MAG TPA: hypothetical protein PLN89_04910 [Elusimicrobiota bacterium]|jgi:ABC-type glycerol-3-phosphate transport system substrate-binding protein|nr:hypothetical protein [Elusimicrobiota bacterium]
MMKRMKGLLMAGAVAVMAGAAMAATTDTVVLTVTPTGTKSLSIDRVSYDFGALNLGTTGNISSSSTVTNDGTLAATWAMRVSVDDAVWVASTTVGADRYKLMALLNAAAPVAADFNAGGGFDDVVVSAGAGLGAVSTATNYSGTQSGVNVLAGSTRGLWFNLDMPTSSSVSTQRSFTVELEAQ